MGIKIVQEDASPPSLEDKLAAKISMLSDLPLKLDPNLTTSPAPSLNSSEDSFQLHSQAKLQTPASMRLTDMQLSFWVGNLQLSKTTPSIEAPLEQLKRKLEPRRQAFLKDIRFLQAMGAQIKADKQSVIIEAIGNIFWSCTQAAREGNSRACSEHNPLRVVLGKFDSKDLRMLDIENLNPLQELLVGKPSPDFMLQQQADSIFESGQDFFRTGTNSIAPFITLHVGIKNGDYSLILWNWFANEPFFVGQYSFQNLDLEKIHTDLQTALKNHLDHFSVETALTKLPNLNPQEWQELAARSSYRFNHPSGWTDQDIKNAGISWNQLAKTFSIILKGSPFASAIDRDNTRPYLYGLSEQKLDSIALEKLRTSALEIKGFPERITLNVPSEDQQVELGKNPQLQHDGKNTLITDKYGNVILPHYRSHLRNGKPMFAGFTILPPYVFSDGKVSQTQNWGVDLARFGYGDHPRLLTLQSLPAIQNTSHTNPYLMHSTLAPSDSKKIEGVFEKVAPQIADVEQWFGLEAGSLVKHIVAVPSSSWNASVRASNPNAFFLWDEILTDIQNHQSDHIVPHEVFHAFDFKYQFSLSPEFTNFFSQLKEAVDLELFAHINESHLYGNKGGHAADNVFEFFATLTNSLRAPEWKKRVDEMTPRVRGLYFHALQTLRSALLNKKPDLIHTPILKQLDERLQSLKEYETYPEFKDLAFKSTAQLLVEQKSLVKIVDALNFYKEVENAREPVAVVIYSEGHSSHFSLIQKTQEAWGKRIKVLALSYEDASALMNVYFEGAISSPSINLFYQGHLVYRSREEEWDVDDKTKISRLAPYIDYYQPSPIPILGPIIDKLTKN